MIPNVDKLIEWIRLNKIEFYSVQLTKESDNSKVFVRDAEESFEDSLSRLRSVMDISQGGRYYFRGKQSEKSQRGQFFEEFANHPANASMSTLSGIPQQAGIGADEMQSRIDKAIADYELRKELDLLRASKDEYEKQIREMDNAWNRIVKRSEPYVGLILSQLVGKIAPGTQVSVAGLTEANDEDLKESIITQDMNNMEDRIQTALEKWAIADTEFVVLLERIAEMAAEKDPMYNMAKSFLNK